MISMTFPVGSFMTARKTPSGPGPGPKENSPPRSVIWVIRARKSLAVTARWGPNGESNGWNSRFSTTPSMMCDEFGIVLPTTIGDLARLVTLWTHSMSQDEELFFDGAVQAVKTVKFLLSLG